MLLALPAKAIDFCKAFVFLSFFIDQFKISGSGPGCAASLNNLGEDVEPHPTSVVVWGSVALPQVWD